MFHNFYFLSENPRFPPARVYFCKKNACFC